MDGFFVSRGEVWPTLRPLLDGCRDSRAAEGAPAWRLCRHAARPPSPQFKCWSACGFLLVARGQTRSDKSYTVPLGAHRGHWEASDRVGKCLIRGAKRRQLFHFGRVVHGTTGRRCQNRPGPKPPFSYVTARMSSGGGSSSRTFERMKGIAAGWRRSISPIGPVKDG